MQWRALALVFTLALPLAAAPLLSPRVTFTESFPGSQPVFFQIVVRRNGAVAYTTIEKPGQPKLHLRFTSTRLAGQVFALAHQLHDFASPQIESKKHVGAMGAKMLAYDDARHHFQQTFNFTTVRAAAELNHIFQGVSTASEDGLRLRREIRYDPLGVIQVLDQIGRDWEQNQISSGAPLVPILRHAAADPDLMHIARRRAARLLRSLTDERHR